MNEMAISAKPRSSLHRTLSRVGARIFACPMSSKTKAVSVKSVKPTSQDIVVHPVFPSKDRSINSPSVVCLKPSLTVNDISWPAERTAARQHVFLQSIASPAESLRCKDDRDLLEASPFKYQSIDEQGRSVSDARVCVERDAIFRFIVSGVKNDSATVSSFPAKNVQSHPSCLKKIYPSAGEQLDRVLPRRVRFSLPMPHTARVVFQFDGGGGESSV